MSGVVVEPMHDSDVKGGLEAVNLGVEVDYSECLPDADEDNLVDLMDEPEARGSSSPLGVSPLSSVGGSEPDHEDNCNLIINYLPQDMLDAVLYSIFEPYGEIQSAKVVRDKGSRKCLGYGFIKYTNEAGALAAIENANGYEIGHKRLKVSFARPPSDNIKNCKLYVTNLPKNYTVEAVSQLFEKYGNIIECRVLLDVETNANKGVAFVQFSVREEAEGALALNGEHLVGSDRALVIKYAEGQFKKGGKRAATTQNVNGRGRSGSGSFSHSGGGRYMDSYGLSGSPSGSPRGGLQQQLDRTYNSGGAIDQTGLSSSSVRSNHRTYKGLNRSPQRRGGQHQMQQQRGYGGGRGGYGSAKNGYDVAMSSSSSTGMPVPWLKDEPHYATMYAEDEMMMYHPEASYGHPQQQQQHHHQLQHQHHQQSYHHHHHHQQQPKKQHGHGTVFMVPGGQSKESQAQVTLVVLGLPEAADVALLQDYFAPYGRIINVQIVLHTRNALTGKGVVVLEGIPQAQHALQSLHGAIPFEGGEPLQLHISNVSY